MARVSIRDLSRNPSAFINKVSRSKKPILVTRHGKILAAILPANSDMFEDYILSSFFAKDVAKTEADLVAGRLKTLDQVMAEIEAGDLNAKGQPRKARRTRHTQAARRRSSKGGGRARKTVRGRAER